MTLTRRWRIDLAYDGTDFHGWARQQGLRTVQGELEHWIATVLRIEPVTLTVAGRTDAGVHARGQVAHVDLADGIDGEPLAHRLRRALPADIVIAGIRPAPEGFDARFSAIWRRYTYRIWDATSRPDPLVRAMVTAVPEALDVEAMNTAAATLLGLRDFAPFCRYREGATTIRDLTALRVHRLDDTARTVQIDVQADAFCHSMVRSLVGALWAVGAGRRDQAWLARVAASAERHPEVHVMRPQGLCLEEVGYPADDLLAARAVEARAFRVLGEQEVSQ